MASAVAAQVVEQDGVGKPSNPAPFVNGVAGALDPCLDREAAPDVGEHLLHERHTVEAAPFVECRKDFRRRADLHDVAASQAAATGPRLSLSHHGQMVRAGRAHVNDP